MDKKTISEQNCPTKNPALSNQQDWLSNRTPILKEGICARLCQDGLFHFGVTFKTGEEAGESHQWGNLDLHLPGDKAPVIENRESLSSLTLPLSRWVVSRQQHTDTIVRVSSKEAGKGSLDYEDSMGPADALCTTDPNLLLGVFTADCIGLIITDPSVPSAAVIHSGWKGTAKAIVMRSAEFMKKEGILHPEQAQAWFSPSLQKQSLEVGLEVVQAMEEMAEREGLNLSDCILPHENPQKRYIDNQELCIRMLLAQGFHQENIHPALQDTKTDETCFSYRRDGLQGEHFTFAWISPYKEQNYS